MASATIRVRIDRDAVIRMNQPTGMVHRWTVGLADEVLDICIVTAPERSGELKLGLHRGSGSWSRAGVSVRVISDAKHTTYVHGGTYGGITAKSHRAMRLGSLNPSLPIATRANRKSLVGTRANRSHARMVGGQKAKPFMSRALRQVMAKHSI